MAWSVGRSVRRSAWRLARRPQTNRAQSDVTPASAAQREPAGRPTPTRTTRRANTHNERRNHASEEARKETRAPGGGHSRRVVRTVQRSNRALWSSRALCDQVGSWSLPLPRPRDTPHAAHHLPPHPQQRLAHGHSTRTWVCALSSSSLRSWCRLSRCCGCTVQLLAAVAESL